MDDHQSVEELLVALKDPDPLVRAAAANTLDEVGDERAIEPLIAALQDVDSEVRTSAIGPLAKIGGIRALEPLLQALSDETGGLSYFAAFAFRTIGEVAVEPLLKILKEENVDWTACEYAARALSAIGGDRGREALIEALKFGNNVGRASAAWELRAPGFGKLEPLVEALKNDEDEMVRCNAALALSQISDKRAIEPLIEALNDNSSNVRFRAAEVLGWTGSKQALEPLAKLALEDQTKTSLGEKVSTAAIVAIENINKERKLRQR